jgi:hypothetical protein
VKGKKVHLASVRDTFKRAGKAKVKVKLTAAGRRLLRAAARIKLTAVATFEPPGARSTRVTGSFTLRR